MRYWSTLRAPVSMNGAVATAPWLVVIQCDNRNPSTWKTTKPLRYVNTALGQFSAGILAANGDALTHPTPYWALSALINRFRAQQAGGVYAFYHLEATDVPDRHWTWGKIAVLQRAVDHFASSKVILFLDGDAWIRDVPALVSMLQRLAANDHACVMLSEDVVNGSPKATRINTGAMAWKPTALAKRLLDATWNIGTNEPDTRRTWPHEQGVLDRLHSCRRYHSPLVAERPCPTTHDRRSDCFAWSGRG